MRPACSQFAPELYDAGNEATIDVRPDQFPSRYMATISWFSTFLTTLYQSWKLNRDTINRALRDILFDIESESTTIEGHSMEPTTALGVAAAATQFFDIARNLIGQYQDSRQPPVSQTAFRKTAVDLRKLSTTFKQRPTPPSQDINNPLHKHQHVSSRLHLPCRCGRSSANTRKRLSTN